MQTADAVKVPCPEVVANGTDAVANDVGSLCFKRGKAVL